MTLEILLSCMHQKDASIIKASNIQTQIVVINQCNIDKIEHDTFINNNGDTCESTLIHTTQRGLSKSRNLAIMYATGDICVICDDDEEFVPNYQNIILDAFKKYPKADIIAFQVERKPLKKYPKKAKQLGALDCLKVSSVEIAFKLSKIKENNIHFDEQIGSGVSKAGGEENIFLHDCIRNNLSVYFIPITIAQLLPSESQWNANKFTKEYFIDRGKFTCKLIGGKIFAILYALYFGIFKYPIYKNKTTMKDAIFYMLYGIFKKHS